MLQRPPSRRTPRARWQADYRRRVRNGEGIAPVGYNTSVIEFLIRTHWLDPEHICDRHKIGAAIARMLADAAKR
jgi:hypothetical protein